MSISVTPIPRITDLAAPDFTLGTSNVAGSAVTAVASNSTLLAFDTTLPAATGTAAVGTATVAPRRDHVHSGTALAAPSLTLGTANSAGGAATAFATNSTILAFDTTLPAATGTAAVGTATVAPRRDHVHAGRALAAPALTLGTANGAGSATSTLATDSTILAFDTTLPDAITYSQSGATGSATVASRRDHAHAMAAEPTAPDQASQSALEAETDENTYAAPDMIKYSPGVAKAWGEYGADGALQTPNYNIASVAKESTGLYLVTFDIDFTDSNHSTPVCPTADIVEVTRLTNQVGSIKFRSKQDGTLTDSGLCFSGFGDQ